jgi:antitoxin component YwqK of YwqJK toxin-antitoxin module
MIDAMRGGGVCCASGGGPASRTFLCLDRGDKAMRFDRILPVLLILGAAATSNFRAAAQSPNSYTEADRQYRWDQAQKASQESWNRIEFRRHALPYLKVPDDSEQVKLAAGKTLDMKAVYLDELTTFLKNGDFFPANRYVVKFNVSDERVLALIAAEKGIIKGPVLVFHDNGNLAAAAAFSDGSQTGSLLTWTPEGKRALFAQYKLSHRNGYFCLFDDAGKLKFVEEFKHDKSAGAYAIKDDAVVEASNPDGGFPFGGVVAAGSADLEASLKQTVAAEIKMKNALADWDQNLRKISARENGVAARKAILERGRSENSGLITALRQWSTGYRLRAALP